MRPIIPNYSLDTYYAKIIPSIIYQGLMPHGIQRRYQHRKKAARDRRLAWCAKDGSANKVLK